MAKPKYDFEKGRFAKKARERLLQAKQAKTPTKAELAKEMNVLKNQRNAILEAELANGQNQVDEETRVELITLNSRMKQLRKLLEA